MLRLGSYNIAASYFTDPNLKNPDDVRHSMPHQWAQRKHYFPQIIDEIKCDVIALQELSPEQAIDILEMFSEKKRGQKQHYKLAIFMQAQTTEIESGSIYESIEEIEQNLLGKNTSAPIIAIMWNPKTVSAIFKGIFWYNPKPFERPLATDRSVTDKGFGNMNTPRGPGYIRFKHIETQKDFYFFTSHAPISGGSNARKQCFELENKVIRDLVGDSNIPFFSVGDRNLIPDQLPPNSCTNGNVCTVSDAYHALVNPAENIFDWMNSDNHSGFFGTWLGYLYEPIQFQNQIKSDGTLTNQVRLDIGTSSLKSIDSAHYHCVIRDDEVELLGSLSELDNVKRNFFSDHLLLTAGFLLQ